MQQQQMLVQHIIFHENGLHIIYRRFNMSIFTYTVTVIHRNTTFYAQLNLHLQVNVLLLKVMHPHSARLQIRVNIMSEFEVVCHVTTFIFRQYFHCCSSKTTSKRFFLSKITNILIKDTILFSIVRCCGTINFHYFPKSKIVPSKSNSPHIFCIPMRSNATRKTHSNRNGHENGFCCVNYVL